MTKSNASSNAALAFSSLATFARWWTEFEASHCKGIQATWTVNAKLLLKLKFQRGCWKWQHMIDLTDSDWENELLTLDVGLIKLQAVPQEKTEQSKRPEGTANPDWEDSDWKPSDKVCRDCGKLVWEATWFDGSPESGGAAIGIQWECGDCGWFDVQ
jgi:hypothetical protein